MRNENYGSGSVFVATPVGPTRTADLPEWKAAVLALDWEWPVAFAWEECEPDEHGILDAKGTASHFWQTWGLLLPLSKGFSYVLSLDSDVILPPEALKVLMSHMENDVWAVMHAYPKRGGDGLGLSAGLGLFRRDLLAAAHAEYADPACPRTAWETQLAAEGNWGDRHGWRTVRIWEPEMEVEHRWDHS